MIEELKAVVCTSCGARLKVKAAAQRVKCGKCSHSFDVAAVTANTASVRPTNGHPPRFTMPPSSSSSIPPQASESTAPLGFFSYVWRSYSHTHSSLPFLFAVILGLLLMPVLSFLKPKIGVEFMVGSCVIALAMSALLFGVLVVIVSSRYLFGKQRTIAADQRSWLSAFACFLGFLSPSLGVVSAVESFAPAEGLFVKLVPQFKAEQTRLLGEIVDEAAEPNAETDGNGSTSEVADETPRKSKPKDSDDGDREIAASDTNNSGPAKQAADTTVDADHGEPAEESAPKKVTTKTTPSTKKGSSKAASTGADLKTKEVIAEGVGTTRSEAEKDAFRRAVREVVGLVVDSETLIKNDELIDDKVLTYSDGFIKKGWETLSEKTKGGLVHLKIKVEVEQRSVVAKLKAANITVKQVDGKGLFAEAVTKLDAEKDAAALLKKQFAELPTLLTASIDGEPQFDKEASEVKAQVIVQVDREAYAAYVKRLEPVLAKVAVAKDSTLLTAELEKNQNGSKSSYWNKSHPALGGPTLTSTSQWCIWVNHFHNATDTTLKWNCYVVESDPIDIVRAIEMPNAEDHELDGTYGNERSRELRRVYRPSDAKTVVKLSALDSDGKLITEGESELFCGRRGTYDSSYNGGIYPFLRHFIVRDLKGESSDGGGYGTITNSLVQQKDHSDQRYRKTINLYVSPYALSAKTTRYGFSVGYYPQARMTQRLKVTLEELKRIAKFQCEVSYKPATGKAVE